MQSLRILCAADLHLGRRLTRLPEELETFAEAPKLAWSNLVEYALESSHQIDAIVLAGDIFDNEENLYETLGAFEKGVRRILACNIPIIAVAGNHDGDVLLRLSLRLNIPHFHLLGKNETWESITLELGRRAVRFVGWSFASSKYVADPLATFPDDEAACLTIGVLHCDVDAGKKSPYAPVELRRFKELTPKAWILGHVHIPTVLSEEPFVCYCGSLQGLDPSEAGERGAVLLEVSPSHKIISTRIPLAPLLFHSQSVDLSDSTPQSFDGDLCFALKQGIGELKDKVKAVLCRFILEGRSRFLKELRAFADRIESRDFTQVGSSWVPCFVESVLLRCTPAVDLNHLCKGRDFAAVIAQLIQLRGSNAILSEAASFLHEKIELNGQLDITMGTEELSSVFARAGYEVLEKIFLEEGK